MIILETTEKCLLLVHARLAARGSMVATQLHKHTSFIYNFTCDVPDDNFRHDREVFATRTS